MDLSDDEVWRMVEEDTEAIRRAQSGLDRLYAHRVEGYRELLSRGVTLAAIGQRLGINPRGIAVAMKAKRSAGPLVTPPG